MGGYVCLTCIDRELESRSPAMAAEAQKPFGWAQPKGGNYFTRNESSAKRVGGLVPVYAAPQPAQADARAGLIAARIARLRAAIEGECDGLNVDYHRAKAILAHLDDDRA